MKKKKLWFLWFRNKIIAETGVGKINIERMPMYSLKQLRAI